MFTHGWSFCFYKTSSFCYSLCLPPRGPKKAGALCCSGIFLFFVFLLLFPYNFLKLICCIFIFIQFKKFSFFGHASCGILVPQPGIKPSPPAVETWSPNHWTARDPLGFFHINFYVCGLFELSLQQTCIL